MITEISPTYEKLSHTAARWTSALVQKTVGEYGRCSIALSGGSTPRRLYELLARERLPWTQIHLFWGDERFVPHDHPKSNVHLVRETLLRNSEIPHANVHPMPITGSPSEAAEVYADTLQNAFANRGHTFDLALLGMGEDGHTASLFPENDCSPNDPEWVRAVSAPPRHDITQRLTCTLPVLNEAREAFVLVAGTSKRDTVRAVIEDRDPKLPITHIQPRERLVWFLDSAAAPPSLYDGKSA